MVEANDAALRICEFGRNAVIGKPLRGLADRCDGNCVGALGGTLKTRQPVKLRFVECRSMAGKQQVVSVTASPLLGVKGRSAGAVMGVRDKTRLVSLERRLQERQRIDSIVGRSEAIEKVRAMIRDLADVQTTVLISGVSRRTIYRKLERLGIEKRPSGPGRAGPGREA